MSTISGFTLAVFDMDKMLSFYGEVFDIQFTSAEIYGYTVYNGDWNDMTIQLCPAELARNETKQNRHQLTIEVSNIRQIVEEVEGKGGSLLGDIMESEREVSIGIYDPDNNSLVLKQLK